MRCGRKSTCSRPGHGIVLLVVDRSQWHARCEPDARWGKWVSPRRVGKPASAQTRGSLAIDESRLSAVAHCRVSWSTYVSWSGKLYTNGAGGADHSERANCGGRTFAHLDAPEEFAVTVLHAVTNVL